MIEKNFRLLVCAGGTGGGIYPALTLVNYLIDEGLTRSSVLWIGIEGEMEEQLVPKEGIELELIRGGAIAGVSLIQKIKNGAKLLQSIWRSYRLISGFQPKVLFMTGGYMAVPVAVASWLRRVPIVVFLPDIEPGSAIKAVAPISQKVACTTEESEAYVDAKKLVVTGYPVREAIREALNLSKPESLQMFRLKPDRPTLFVFGGSRGARNINRALMKHLPQLLLKYQVIHISGTLTWPEVEQFQSNLDADLSKYYRPFSYLHDLDMGAAFRSADLVVARAGASMLGECPTFALPSILVPLAFAWRYQEVNAAYLTDNGAALTVSDDEIHDKLYDVVTSLLDNSDRRLTMSAAARALQKPNASQNLADLVLRVGQGSVRGVPA